MSTVPLVTYEYSDGISTISMDDGKANVMSVEMVSGINAALDQAEGNGGVVIITGRDKMFSAGFDLGVFKSGDSEIIVVSAGCLRDLESDSYNSAIKSNLAHLVNIDVDLAPTNW